LRSIRSTGCITISSGWGSIATGIHVEIDPFGTARPGRGGPKADLACNGEGAFVEFDAPPTLVRYYCGPRNTGIIPSDVPLRLESLHPVYVVVRRWFWQIWRTKVD
jgi:hypothetical protein